MKKISIFLVIATIIIGISMYLMLIPQKHNMTTAEKEQALTKLLGHKVDLSNKKKAENVEYKDSFVEFSYPGDAAVYAYRDPGFASGSGLLASFSYDTSEPKVVFNYAAVARQNIKSLSDDPSYRLRELPSRGYKKNITSLDHISGILFEKDDPQASEKSIFIFKDGTLYTFVATSADSRSLSRIISLVSSTLRFK